LAVENGIQSGCPKDFGFGLLARRIRRYQQRHRGDAAADSQNQGGQDEGQPL
jgi:hypothetical protein